MRTLPPYARPPVWPAYLVAAVCFTLAIATTLSNLAMTSQLRQLQGDAVRNSGRASALARNLALERTALSDLESPRARHYASDGGEVIASNGRLYVLMRDLPMPPRGRVYQAWIRTTGARAMTPSMRFIPDPHGLAIVALDGANASQTSAVAVSVEPESGSTSPSSPFVLDVTLGA